MKRLIILLGILAILVPVSADAIVGLALGGKVGYADYSGEVLPNSGDLGGSTYYGVVLELTTLPLLDFEFHANYFTKEFNYAFEGFGVEYAAGFEFQDFHVLALAKKNIIAVPTSPFSLYVGGGVGYHFMNTEVALMMAGSGFDTPLTGDPVSMATEVGKMSADGLAGMKLSFPSAPLAVFGEARYGVIFTDSSIQTFQAECGVMLDF
jgi:hypothetical protein